MWPLYFRLVSTIWNITICKTILDKLTADIYHMIMTFSGSIDPKIIERQLQEVHRPSTAHWKYAQRSLSVFKSIIGISIDLCYVS